MDDVSANPAVQGGDKRPLRVYKLRLRDKHATELKRQSRAVNFVWNFCNETQQKAVRSSRKWLGYHDLAGLTAGAAMELDLHAHTIQRVCREYDKSRRQQRKPWLRWRGRKSLGWVPFNTGHVTFDGSDFTFRGKRYEVMHLRDMPAGIKIAAGSFNADSRGRWYINVPVEVDYKPASADRIPVGIDLGLHSLATLSTGEKIEAPQFYRKSEAALATAQRAKKTKRARAIHAKAANRRKDHLHKASRKIAATFGLIVIGDVSPSKIAKTSMAKSVLDAGWSDFKRMLAYKAITHGANTLEVSERWTSQTCSECGVMPASRPRGIAGLRERVWSCSDCGAVHDRDVNAARNILALGLGQQTLGGGAHV
jgi:putative transposase